MADKHIGALPEASQITLEDLFVLEQSSAAKKLTGKTLLNELIALLDGHGGIKSIVKVGSDGLVDTYRITFSDDSTYDYTVTNGRSIVGVQKTGTSGNTQTGGGTDTYTITYSDNTTSTFTVTNGAPGASGRSSYVWIKYASQQPTVDNPSIGDIPDEWMGIYSGQLPAAPSDWSAYTWFYVAGKRGLSFLRLNAYYVGTVERYNFSDFVLPDGYAPMVGDLVLMNEGYLGYVYQVFSDSQQADVASLDANLRGPTGATPILSVGNVATLEPGNDAYVTITGTTDNPKLNFGIPKGEGSLFVFTVTQNEDGSYSADKTRVEVLTAHEANMAVYCDLVLPGVLVDTTVRIPLVSRTPIINKLIFEGTYKDEIYRIQYYYQDAVEPYDENAISVTISASGGTASVELDTTLTKSGMAADAGAVGEALAGKQPVGDYPLREELPIVPVQSVNGKTGDVVLDAASVGGYTRAEVDAIITALKAQGVQQVPALAHGTTLDECMAWLNENGDTSKVYIMPKGISDEVYGYMLTPKEVESEPNYTNLLPTAVDTDGTTIYGGDYNGDGVNDGYKTPMRLSSSGSTSSAAEPACASGFINVNVGDVVRIKNMYAITGVNSYVISYDSANTKLVCQTMLQSTSSGFWMTSDWATIDNNDGNLLTFTITADTFGEGVSKIRFSGDMTSGDVIVTINEEIAEGDTTIVEEYAWVSTGRAFIPADYEDRIIAAEEQIAENTADIATLKKSAVDTGGVDALTWIRNWDSPIYDRVPVFLLDTEKSAVTSDERTADAIYAKYDALVAAHPNYITRTDLGFCSDGTTHVYRYDFCEPEPHHHSGMQWSETKPVVIIVSGIHNEQGGVHSLYYAMEEIANNAVLDDLRRNVHFVVLPLINPYVFVGAYKDTYYVKNANGVEIHRNFEVGFIYPDDSGYVVEGELHHGGTQPLSEVESQYLDAIFREFPDAALFMTCHSAQRDTQWGTGFIWASTATNYTCNLGFRLVDKMSKAWHTKYGTTWEEGCVRENEYVLADTTTYPYATALAEGDYRAGHAHVSSTNGTETRQATKYGIQGANVEVLDTFWVLDDTNLGSKVTTHGAEVYINYLLMYMGGYDHKDKKRYCIE